MNWLEFSFYVNYDIVFEYKEIYYNIVFNDSETILYKAPGVKITSEPVDDKEKILDFQFDNDHTLKEILFSDEVNLIDYISEK